MESISKCKSKKEVNNTHVDQKMGSITKVNQKDQFQYHKKKSSFERN